jgi:CRISPR-associated protein Cas1
MLLGRLGLETARLPHADRHGLISLDRGHLTVEDGCLTFASAGGGSTPAGRYGIPHQSVSLILLGPGSMVSHDALRLLARHGVGLAAVGDDGVRLHDQGCSGTRVVGGFRLAHCDRGRFDSNGVAR